MSNEKKKNQVTLDAFQFDGAARLPQYVEVLRREHWVKYGETNNLYSSFQLYYQNVPIHRSCLQAKINGITGKALTTKDPAHQDLIMFANPTEDIYSLYKKMVKDYVVLGSFGLQVVRANDGGIAHYYHTPVDKWRSGKSGEDDIVRDYYFSEQWERYREPRYAPQRVAYFSMENTEDARQFYYYKDYEPNGQFYYGYPSYISAVPSLQLSTEIINHHLTSVQNSMTPSMALSLVGEIPPAEERQNILDKLKMLYGGTNGQKFFLNFIESNEQKPQVDVITPTTTDGLYENIDKLITQNIITAHQITSPLLLGIRESGTSGLGNNKDEILISYNHFINTSCKPVQRILLGELERMIFLKTKTKVELVLEQNPILDIDELPSEIGVKPKGGEVTSTLPEPGSETEMSINDNLKKLSGREYQNLMRIVREYTKNKLTREMAKQMLKSGYGLTEEECSAYLGEEEETI
jgi:capsid portal protein